MENWALGKANEIVMVGFNQAVVIVWDLVYCFSVENWGFIIKKARTAVLIGNNQESICG